MYELQNIEVIMNIFNIYQKLVSQPTESS